MRNTAVLGVILAFSVAGCFNPEIADGGFACDPNDPQPCPGGYFCRNLSGAFLCARSSDGLGGGNDLASSGGEDDKFIFPEEGTLIWTDNMLIPKGAANRYTAELMMNYVYDPKVAAQIAEYVYYVSPVKGADEEIKKVDPDAASNPLLFPTPDVVAKQHNFQSLTDDIEKTMNDLFSKLSGT